MEDLSVSQEVQDDISRWGRFHFGEDLAGMAIFDPSKVDPAYPVADINLLLLLSEASEFSKERYSALTEMVLSTIVHDNESIQCRIQTVEELEMIAELGLPILSIYLKNSVIIYDPKQRLSSWKDQVT